MNPLKQTKYPDFIITFDIANSIVDILVEHCGVNANRRKTIVDDLMWGKLTEYRFQGNLGFGGKLNYNNSKIYISYYLEDKTPEKELMVEIANNKLSEIYSKYAVFNKIS
jgi:hypothetical protein